MYIALQYSSGYILIRTNSSPVFVQDHSPGRTGLKYSEVFLKLNEFKPSVSPFNKMLTSFAAAQRARFQRALYVYSSLVVMEILFNPVEILIKHSNP